MFLGRTNELNQIRSLLAAPGKKSLMLYGKRRVGKSALILEAVKTSTCKVLYYECLMTSLEDNLRHIERRIQDLYHNQYLHFQNFEDIFHFLGSTNEEILLIIDEYSYLKTISEKYYIDSLFQRIIDQMQDNITLVILGSFVSMMKELLEKDNPLFGRFRMIMKINDFDYLDSSLFYTECTVKEKVDFYSVFGGSPYACSFINPLRPLEENLEQHLLNPYGILHSYLENVLLSELTKVSNANLILSALSNGKMRYSELENMLNLKSNGNLDKQLKVLLDMDIISKIYPINKRGDKRKTFYEISDNLVRFYYRYIYGNRDVIMRIGESAYYRLYIQPTLITYISHRFEEISRQYFYRLSRQENTRDIYDIGTFWYDIPSERKNGEFDCVLAHENTFSFYEVKYYDHPMSLAEMEQEYKKVQSIASFVSIKSIGFVCLSGFEEMTPEMDYIDGRMLYADTIRQNSN